MKNTLVLKKLTKNFGDLCAVNNISFTAHEGEIIALLGPNGAGKSTLMNMITGYLAPTSGEILILNKSLKQNSLYAKQNIGFLPEGSPLYADMSVKSFLNYIAELHDLKEDKKTKRIQEVCHLAKIETVLEQKIETLSKGFNRRVGFAQSILSNPPILLLDEPTDGLDPNQKEHIRAQISQIGKQKTILISTHLLDEAESICNRIIIIDHGQIKADGTLTEILTQTQCPTLARAFKKLTQAEKNND